MYVADLRFDQPISPDALQSVVSEVLGQPSDLAIRTETHQFHFPYLVRVILPSSEEGPSLEQFQAIARTLQAMFITDDVTVGELWDDGFSLISPDGFTAVVRVEDEGANGDDLVLYPESREIYRSVAARLTAAAAD